MVDSYRDFVTGVDQEFTPLCPFCPFLGLDQQGQSTAVHGNQRAAQEALLTHLRTDHGWDDLDSPPVRLLPEGETLCTTKGCRRDHAAEVEYATNHMTHPPGPYDVIGLNGQLITYAPDREAVVTVSRSLHGILVAYDETVSVLSDDAPVSLLDHLTTVQTAVLAARLRSWAERLEERDVQPRPTP